MGGDDRHCPDCGGEGFHFDGCDYEGTEDYSSYSRRGSGSSGGNFWFFYIMALIIGYGFNELLGTIILIGIIVWEIMRQ